MGDTCLEGCTLPIYKRVVQQHRGGDLIVRFGFEQGDSMEVIRDRAHPLSGRVSPAGRAGSGSIGKVLSHLVRVLRVVKTTHRTLQKNSYGTRTLVRSGDLGKKSKKKGPRGSRVHRPGPFSVAMGAP